jgi:EAL domain-containing protein (putative c-di-GMP-specific phosphodiesterase class I)
VQASGGAVWFDAGVTLFHEGDPSDLAYLIADGTVEVSIRRDGERRVLCRKGPGELFGEMALVEGGRRSATVTTLTPCELTPITREQLLGKLEQADPVLRLCLSLLMNRLRWTAEQVQATAALPPICPIQDRARVTQAIRLEHELERALAEGQLELHYQPIVVLPRGGIVGLEALIRWRHPERGLVAPGFFLPTAEACGLIRRIDAWAVSEACAALPRLEAARRADGRSEPPLFVSVNIAAPTLRDATFVDHVRGSLRGAGVSPRSLKLELTETVLMGADVERVLGGCRELGVGVALDDFGTGYSSLSYLHRFPIDLVKLDRSFVQDANAATGAPPILRGILRLTEDLGLSVVAEGIERAEQASLVGALGAGHGQGFHFSRPLPAEAAAALLARGIGGLDQQRSSRPAEERRSRAPAPAVATG